MRSDFSLKSTRATTGTGIIAVVLSSVLNIPQKVPGTTRWAFKKKYDGSSKARQAVLGWRQKHGIDCVITFVCTFDLLAIASTKRVNIPDVQCLVKLDPRQE